MIAGRLPAINDGTRTSMLIQQSMFLISMFIRTYSYMFITSMFIQTYSYIIMWPRHTYPSNI